MTSPYGTGTVSTFALSGDNTIDALVNVGIKWGAGGQGVSATVTYSFPQGGAAWIGDYWNGEPFDGFQGFNATQRNAARQALQLWSEVANITFVEVADTAGDVGDIRFGFSNVVTNSTASAWAYLPYADPSFEYPEAGDIWFDHAYGPNLQMAPGQFGFSTLIHEIGHAIGLDHPFDDGFGEPTLPASIDNNQYTIMAYDLHPTASIEAMTPMLLDILAIQYIYGANMTTRTGNDVYTFSNTTEELRAIWDAGGIDTINCSNQTLGVTINLNDGAFSSIGKRNAGGSASNNIAIAYNAIIENATGGSGNDKITGNEFVNVLIGNAGNDTLDGGIGADTLRGGKGNDIYVLDDLGDVVDEQGNTDTADEVRIGTSVNLTTFAAGAIERATALGSTAVSMMGNNAANILTGNGADNYLEGGSGNDTLRGGKGNDTYFIETTTDVIDEQGNTDTGDWVRTRVTVNLATRGKGAIENATLWSNDNIGATGNAGANTIYGGIGNNTIDGAGGNDVIWAGDGNDTLIGGSGNDYLDGAGGSDVMRGGSGNDIYIVDSTTDVVDEQINTDTGDDVRAYVSVDLTKIGAGAIDLAMLLGSAAINATGNERNNRLAGNSADNVLSGAGGEDALVGSGGNDTLLGGAAYDWLDGGTGNDLLRGGSGNDRYIVDSVDDIVDEETNTDTADEVRAPFSIDLATYANGKLENAVLLGTAALNAWGNDAANLLWGNEGANTLDGRDGNDTVFGNGGNDTLIGGNGNDWLDGGAGNDALVGGIGSDVLRAGGGNDIYVLDDLSDSITEAGSKDTGDEIQAAFAINLSSYDGGSIENATLLGAAAINAIGTSADNKLVGNSADNTLDGGAGNDYLDGGLGNDSLLGGSGNDIYVIDSLTDIVNEEGNNDIGDEIRTGALSINLATIAGGVIENAMLLGSASLDITGTTLSNKLTGNSAANVIDGGAGNDILDGGTGDDTLRGGAGNDVYIVDGIGDVVDEQGSDIGDELRTAAFSIDFATFLPGKIEHGTLLGTANLSITGSSASNILTGNSGKNILDGGSGADTLRGGAGNDIYIIDFGDTIDEQGNIDTGDEVRSDAISLNLFMLGNGAVENATLLGVTSLSVTGNALNNALSGNSANNFLSGAGGNDLLIGGAGNDDLEGGAGNDTMKGGSGNDTYYIDSLQDAVDEEGNTDSADLVRTSVSVDLSTLGGGAIENASQIVGEGTNVSLKGNSGANVLTGTTDNNILDGGSGNDTLISGGGLDKLFGGEGDDQIVVLSVTGLAGLTIDGGSGTDTLKFFGPMNADLTLIPNTAIQGIERIDMSSGGSSMLTVSAQDVDALSDSSAALFVVGDANDQVKFTGTVSFAGYEAVDGVDYKTYTYGSSKVYVDNDIEVLANPIAPLLLAVLDDSQGFRIDGTVVGEGFGTRPSGVGDINQDGFEDVLMVGGQTAYLLYGQNSAYDGPVSAKNPVGASVAELSVNSGVSATVSGLGDFDGDGVVDFAVGDWGASFGQTGSGGAYIIYGDSSGVIDQSSLWTLDSASAARFAGSSFGEGASGYRGLNSAGDMNGDGYDDLLVSASSSGNAYVAFGRSDQPSTISGGALDGTDGFVFKRLNAVTSVGKTVSGNSDFNGDGYSDIVIGSNTDAHVIFGHNGAFDAELQGPELDGTTGFTFTGGSFIVGQGGDFNGDGFDDFVLSTPTATIDNQNNAGAVYVVFGKQTGFPTTFNVSQLNGSNGFKVIGMAGHEAGESVSLSGDFNADGFDDLLIGAPGWSGQNDDGSAFVIFGHGDTTSAALSLGDIDGISGFEIKGVNSFDGTGTGVSSADLNGDGFDEIIIGSPAGDGGRYPMAAPRTSSTARTSPVIRSLGPMLGRPSTEALRSTTSPPAKATTSSTAAAAPMRSMAARAMTRSTSPTTSSSVSMAALASTRCISIIPVRSISATWTATPPHRTAAASRMSKSSMSPTGTPTR